MPLPSPQPAQPALQPPSTPAALEILIGRLTAGAVAELAQAVRDWQRDGDARSSAKLAAGDGIARLVLLKQATAGEIADFEATARVQALQMLRQRCGANVSDALLAGLIDDVLRLVDRVVRTQWH
jgi:hypothetical protein